jgi:hypothetical protein
LLFWRQNANSGRVKRGLVPPGSAAAAIFLDEERPFVVALHNGWRGFLYPLLLPGDHGERTFGMDDFSRSGNPKEIYHHAAFDPAGIQEKILSAVAPSKAAKK